MRAILTWIQNINPFFPLLAPGAGMKSHDLIILNPCGSSEIGPDVTRGFIGCKIQNGLGQHFCVQPNTS